MQAYHTIETPINAVGAVSILRIVSDDMEWVCGLLKINPLSPGQIRLGSIVHLDEALLACFEPGSLLIMPHGGIGITKAISEALNQLGIQYKQPSDPQAMFPEAEDVHEARMLQALAIAPSPMAVDVLLDQPRRWRGFCDEQPCADARMMNRLLVPPIVVAVGRANIGKSSLVNALAGASVAMVSDHAGTTRDHVGVMLDLGGLVVRWVDTPGVDETVAVGEELKLVGPVFQSADLVIHAIDHDDAQGQLDPRLIDLINPMIPTLRVRVRSDLGAGIDGLDCADYADCSCSSQTGEGIQTLAQTIKERLVPSEALADPRPWRFWDS